MTQDKAELLLRLARPVTNNLVVSLDAQAVPKPSLPQLIENPFGGGCLA